MSALCGAVSSSGRYVCGLNVGHGGYHRHELVSNPGGLLPPGSQAIEWPVEWRDEHGMEWWDWSKLGAYQ